MRLPTLNSVSDVVQRQLCCGCGACAYVSPDKYEMIDTLEHGRRPRARGRHAADGGDPEALAACPGIGLEHDFDRGHPGLVGALLPGWGPVLEIWEGHAADETIRFAASSGGAASAIALACIEAGGMHGVLHVKARPDAPYLNHTVLSITRREVLEATGSRYAPASPCDGLQMIEDAPAPCVFIGKPCDVAALDKTRRSRPALNKRVGVTIAFFCAGTPTTKATLDLLKRVGVDDPSTVVDLRYRGRGWPGRAAVTVRTADGLETRTLSYEESWGEILTNHKQWRCHVCADHTGELADISVGDPWHRAIRPGEPGESLVLVRTERGRRVVRDAMNAGYLTLERADPSLLPASQPNLLRGRGAVWGRVLACRLGGVPAPRYRGLPTFRFWWSALTPGEKLRSVAGTLRRIIAGRLRTRISCEPLRSARGDGRPTEPPIAQEGNARGPASRPATRPEAPVLAAAGER
ncbi:MAG: Coenzyme F420 hydrogenase/dehydrogenase, beta subunit C-terminal domain [Planctomycetota bacterium]|jgi:coenzyme F420 hydrogenase subunit beta